MSSTLLALIDSPIEENLANRAFFLFPFSQSEYNSLKARALEPPTSTSPSPSTRPVPLPPIQPNRPPSIPTQRPVLQRAQTAPHQIESGKYRVVAASKPGIWDRMSSGFEIITNSLSRPSNSRPSTPPSAKNSPKSNQSTTLTPTLVNFSFDSNLASTSTLRSAISEATSQNIDTRPTSNQSPTRKPPPNPSSTISDSNSILVAPPMTRSISDLVGQVIGGQLMTPHMTVINGVAVKNSLSHPIK